MSVYPASKVLIVISPQLTRPKPNTDTAGEFQTAVDGAESGQDEIPWEGQSSALDAPIEFASSISVGFGLCD
jgi:hypothetical protein